MAGGIVSARDFLVLDDDGLCPPTAAALAQHVNVVRFIQDLALHITLGAWLRCVQRTRWRAHVNVFFRAITDPI